VATARTLAVDAETRRVVMEMRASGVRPILLRGPAFAALLGYAPGERTYVDTDLLVAPGSFPVAEGVLRRLGYHESELERVFRGDRPQHAHTWIGPRGVVDLHRTLVGLPGDGDRSWELLSSRTSTLSMLGHEVEVLGASRGVFVIALHAAQHAGEAGVEADLARAVARVPREAWEEAVELSRLLGAEETFAAGLRTSPEGEKLAESLHLPQPHAHAGVNRGSDTFHLAQGLLWVSGHRGAAAKLKYLRAKLVPPAPQMHSRWTLARRGRVGLLLAHAQRWGVLAARLPLALLALLRLSWNRPRG
jgi:hypothetical protein